MDKNFSLLRYMSQVFLMYGITTGLLNVFCLIFGDSAEGLSTIFSLGSAGVGTKTSFQFLLAVAVITGLRAVFMTDIVIKTMPLAGRIAVMFAGVFAVMVIFIFLFDWFPTHMPVPWIMFAVCFVISCGISTAVSAVWERQENRRLEEALRRFKEE